MMCRNLIHIHRALIFRAEMAKETRRGVNVIALRQAIVRGDVEDGIPPHRAEFSLREIRSISLPNLHKHDGALLQYATLLVDTIVFTYGLQSRAAVWHEVIGVNPRTGRDLLNDRGIKNLNWPIWFTLMAHATSTRIA